MLMSTALVIYIWHSVNFATQRKGVSYLPCFNQHSDAGGHEDHPARLLIVIDEIEQNDDLYNDIRDDLIS